MPASESWNPVWFGASHRVSLARMLGGRRVDARLVRADSAQGVRNPLQRLNDSMARLSKWVGTPPKRLETCPRTCRKCDQETRQICSSAGKSGRLTGLRPREQSSYGETENSVSGWRFLAGGSFLNVRPRHLSKLGFRVGIPRSNSRRLLRAGPIRPGPSVWEEFNK